MLTFIKNNKISVYIFAIIFVISLILNLNFIFGKDNFDTKVYKGTYICNDNELDPTYIVLTSDGKYYMYKQYNKIEESEYIIENNGHILLNDLSESNVLLLVEEKIYYINSENNQVDIFNKKSSSSMFINVQE